MIYAEAVAGSLVSGSESSISWVRRTAVAAVLALNVVVVLTPPAVAVLALLGVLR